MTAPEPDDGSRRTVWMQVGAGPEELPPVRVVAGDLAVRADFDLDTVADLRLAVDEAAAELVRYARPHAALSVTFTMLPEQMQTRMAVPAAGNSAVPTDSFAWRVLTTLTHEVYTEREQDNGQPVLMITLCLHRARSGQAAGSS